MIDAGTVTEADEPNATDLTDDAVVDRFNGEAEDHALEITVGSADGVDVGVEEADETKVWVDVGVLDDSVVGRGTGIDVPDVEGTTAGDVLDFLTTFITDELTGTTAAGDVVDTTGGSITGGFSGMGAADVVDTTGA